MLVAETRLGTRDDSDVAARLAEADPHHVRLSATDRRRSRVRTTTEDGTDLGIVVADDLSDGDVLETADGGLVVVSLAEVDALVLDFAEADVSVTAAVELGHALGNRHWDLAVRETAALFPVTDSRERMEVALDGLLPDGVTVGYETVPPTTFDDATPDHDHDEGGHGTHGHTHDGHDHGHSDGGHDHDHGHTHSVRPIDGGDR